MICIYVRLKRLEMDSIFPIDIFCWSDADHLLKGNQDLRYTYVYVL